MAQTPIQIIVQIIADTKGVVSMDKALAGLSETGKAVGKELAASLNEATAAEKKLAAETKKTTKAAEKAGQTVSKNSKYNKDGTTTAEQLARSHRLLANAWRDNSNVVDKTYLRSITGLRQALKKFDQESQLTFVQGTKRGKQFSGMLSDSEMKMTRFFMKGNLVTRTLSNMAQRFQDVGKNAQWTGRQMMVGITMPIVGIGAAAVKAYLEVDKLDVSLKKLIQTNNPADAANIFSGLDKQSKKIATTLGVTRNEVKQMQTDFASVGFDGRMIKDLTQVATEFQKLANIDQGQATDMVRVLAQRYKSQGLSDSSTVDKLRDSLSKLNLIENKTALNAKDVTGEFSDIFPLFDQFNVTAPQTIALLAAFKQEGVDVGEGATSLKNALTKLGPAFAGLYDDTKDNGARLKDVKNQLTDIGKRYGMSFSFFNEKTGKPRTAIEMIMQVANAYRKLKDEGSKTATALRLKLMRALFVGGRANEGAALFDALGKSMDPVLAKSNDFAKAWAIANDSGKEAASTWSRQLAAYMGSDSTKFANQIEKGKIALQEIGRQIVPPLTKVLQFINKLIDKFNKLSDGAKKKIMVIAASMAALGPIVYIWGQSMIFMGTLFKGLLKPASSFFKMMIKGYLDVANGNPIVDQFAKAVDEVLSNPSEESMKHVRDLTEQLAQGPEIRKQAIAATEAETAAQEALNSAKQEEVAINGEIANSNVAASGTGVRREKTALAREIEAQGAASGVANPLDVYREGQVNRRVEEERAKRVQGIYKGLLGQEAVTKKRIIPATTTDIGVSGKKLKNPRKVSGEELQAQLEEKISEAEEKAGVFSDEFIDKTAREVVDAENEVFDDAAYQGVRERLKGLRKEAVMFEKAFGIPNPIRPDMSITDAGERVRDYETRMNAFVASVSSQITDLGTSMGITPAEAMGRIKADYRAGEPEQLHGIISHAIDQSNLRVGRPTIGAYGGLSTDAVHNPLRELAQRSAEMGDGPQMMTGDTVDAIKRGLEEGPLLERNREFSRKYWEEIDKAFKSGDALKYIEGGIDTSGLDEESAAGLSEGVKKYVDSVATATVGTKAKREKAAKIAERIAEKNAKLDEIRRQFYGSRPAEADEWMAVRKRIKELEEKIPTLKSPHHIRKNTEELERLKARAKELKNSPAMKQRKEEAKEFAKALKDTQDAIDKEIANLPDEFRPVTRMMAPVGGERFPVTTPATRDGRTPRGLTEKSQAGQRNQTLVNRGLRSAFPDNEKKGLEWLDEVLADKSLPEGLIEEPAYVEPRLKKDRAKAKMQYDNLIAKIRRANKAKLDAHNSRNARKQIEDFIQRAKTLGLTPSELAAKEGIPEDLKKPLAAALFGGVHRGDKETGMLRGNKKKGYRGLVRDILGETAGTPLEEETLGIIDEIAGDLVGSYDEKGQFVQGIKGGSGQQRRRFKNLAALSRQRVAGGIKTIPAEFGDELGAALGKDHGLDNIDDAIGKAGKTVDRQKEIIAREKARIAELKAKKASLVNSRKEFNSRLKAVFESEYLPIYEEDTRNGATQAQRNKHKRELRKSIRERLQREDEQAQRVIDDELARASSRLETAKARQKSASEAAAKLAERAKTYDPDAVGTDLEVLDRAMQPSRDANGRVEKVTQMQVPRGTTAADIARRHKIAKVDGVDQLVPYNNSALVDEVTSGAHDARVVAADQELQRLKNSKRYKGRADDIRAAEKSLAEAQAMRDRANAEYAALMKKVEKELKAATYVTGGTPGTFLPASLTKRSLHELTGSLSPEASKALHEMIVTNTVMSLEGLDKEVAANSQLAIDVIKKHMPKLPEELQQAYAQKFYDVAQQVRLEGQTGGYYLGEMEGADGLTAVQREAARQGRGRASNTYDKHERVPEPGNTRAEREVGYGGGTTEADKMDRAINEQARVGTSGMGSKGDPIQRMLLDLQTGFAVDDMPEVPARIKDVEGLREKLIAEKRAAIKKAKAVIETTEAELQKLDDDLYDMVQKGQVIYGDKTYKKYKQSMEELEHNRAAAKASLKTNTRGLGQIVGEDMVAMNADLVPDKDKIVKQAEKKVAAAESDLQLIDSQLSELDSQEAAARRSFRSRRAGRIGAEKKKLLAERDAAEAEVRSAKKALDDAFKDVYEVFNPLTGEVESFASIEEYHKAKLAQAEALAKELDMSDVIARETELINAQLEKEITGWEAAAGEIRAKRLEADNAKRKAEEASTPGAGLGPSWHTLHGDATEEEKAAAEAAAKKSAEKAAEKGAGQKLIDDLPYLAEDYTAAGIMGPKGNRLRGGLGVRAGLRRMASGAKKSVVGASLSNLVNMINPLKKVGPVGEEAAAGLEATAGAAGETTGAFAMMFPTISQVPQLIGPALFNPVTLALVAVGVIVVGLIVTFKKWGHWAEKGIQKVKSAFKGLFNAVLSPLKGLWENLAGGKDKSSVGNFWKNLGRIVGKFLQIISWVIKTITPIVTAVMQIITKTLYVVFQIIRVLLAVFTGNWQDAWDAIKKGFGVVVWGIKKLLASLGMAIIKMLIFPVQKAIQLFAKLLDWMPKSIMGHKTPFGKWADGLEKFNKGVDEGKQVVSDYLDRWVGKDPLAAKKKGKDAAKDVKKGMKEEGDKTQKIKPPEVDPEEAKQNGKEAVQNFISEFQNQLQKVVDGWKEAALAAYDAYTKKFIDNIDARIKAIDDEVAAEQKRNEDLDYLARKDELRAQRKAAITKYHSDYDLAIYEGRYDDAKQLSYDHDKDMADMDKQDKELEKDREKQLTERLRDELKARLELEKENTQKVIDVRREQLQKQLDMMTEFIPRNVAAAQLMHTAIMNKMKEFTNGYGQIGADQAANWNLGWVDAFNKTKKVIAEQAYWSGDAAMKYFAAGLGVDLSGGDSGGAAAGGGSNRPSAGNHMEQNQNWQPKNQPQGQAHGGPSNPNTGLYPDGTVDWGSPFFGNDYSTDTEATKGHKHHTGGPIGPKGSNPYDIPATLQSGEYVIKRSSVNKLGTDYLEHLNETGNPIFHTGGYVSPKASGGMQKLVGMNMKRLFTKAVSLWGRGKAKLKLGQKAGTYGLEDYKGALTSAAGMATGATGTDTPFPGEYASGLNPEFVRRFNAWNAALGNIFRIGSGFRTMAEQARLYARWMAHVPGQAQAAPPGRSNHNYGLAIDLSPASTTAAQRALGAKFGLRWPMGFEPWHVEPVEARQWREQMRAGNPATNMNIGGGLRIRPGVVMPGSGATGDASTYTGPLSRILKTIRIMESGGNYKAHAKGSSASGAYQFVDGTWGNYGGYAHAMDAPPAVQDAKAAANVQSILDRYHNVLEAVPATWYAGSYRGHGKENYFPGGNNKLTVQQYMDKWLAMLSTIPAMGVGGHIYSDGIAKVHAGETVITKKLTDALSGANLGGGDVNIELHFDGGFFGTDRDLEKLQRKLETDIVPKIQKAKGTTRTTFKGVTR